MFHPCHTCQCPAFKGWEINLFFPIIYPNPGIFPKQHLLQGEVSGCQCHSGSDQDKQGSPTSELSRLLPHLDAAWSRDLARIVLLHLLWVSLRQNTESISCNKSPDVLSATQWKCFQQTVRRKRLHWEQGRAAASLLSLADWVLQLLPNLLQLISLLHPHPCAAPAADRAVLRQRPQNKELHPLQGPTATPELRAVSESLRVWADIVTKIFLLIQGQFLLSTKKKKSDICHFMSCHPPERAATAWVRIKCMEKGKKKDIAVALSLLEAFPCHAEPLAALPSAEGQMCFLWPQITFF